MEFIFFLRGLHIRAMTMGTHYIVLNGIGNNLANCELAKILHEELDIDRTKHPFIGTGFMPSNGLAREQLVELINRYRNPSMGVLTLEEMERINRLNYA
ncbi:MAG: hypothetical protein IPJ51_10700 [Saprospiraceae bacterium]|nr:hypothetical protein [Saprospiraceae bacterium]